MKRFATAFYLVALFLSALSFGDSTTQPAADSSRLAMPTTNRSVAWGEPVDGCRLGVSYVPDLIEAGDSVDLMVSVENDGKNKVWLSVVFGEPDFRTEGKGPDAKDIPRMPILNEPISNPGIGGSHFGLAPGQARSWSYRPSKDLIFIDYGSYTAHVNLEFYSIDSAGNSVASTQPTTLSSPEFAVHVVPRKQTWEKHR